MKNCTAILKIILVGLVITSLCRAENEHVEETQETCNAGKSAKGQLCKPNKKAFINLLLVGKTGSGKSATGNSILGNKVFSISKTEKMSSAYGTVENYQVKVVDLPGLDNARNDNLEGIQLVIEQTELAITEMALGYDAILIVIRLGRLTEEDRSVFRGLEIIFGEGYTKNYGIVIVTHEDNYDADEFDGQPIEEWIKTQTGVMKDIISQCNGRIAFFDNKAKDPIRQREQVLKLIQIMQTMFVAGARYMPDVYKNAKEAHAMALRYHYKIVLSEEMKKEIMNLHKSYSTIHDSNDGKLTGLQMKIDYLITQTQELDRGTQQFKRIMDQLTILKSTVQEHINDLKYPKRKVEKELHYSSKIVNKEDTSRQQPRKIVSFWSKINDFFIDLFKYFAKLFISLFA